MDILTIMDFLDQSYDINHDLATPAEYELHKAITVYNDYVHDTASDGEFKLYETINMYYDLANDIKNDNYYYNLITIIYHDSLIIDLQDLDHYKFHKVYISGNETVINLPDNHDCYFTTDAPTNMFCSDKHNAIKTVEEKSCMADIIKKMLNKHLIDDVSDIICSYLEPNKIIKIEHNYNSKNEVKVKHDNIESVLYCVSCLTFVVFYGLDYNVLRVMEGMSGLAYAQ